MESPLHGSWLIHARSVAVSSQLIASAHRKPYDTAAVDNRQVQRPGTSDELRRERSALFRRLSGTIAPPFLRIQAGIAPTPPLRPRLAITGTALVELVPKLVEAWRNLGAIGTPWSDIVCYYRRRGPKQVSSDAVRLKLLAPQATATLPVRLARPKEVTSG